MVRLLHEDQVGKGEIDSSAADLGWNVYMRTCRVETHRGASLWSISRTGNHMSDVYLPIIVLREGDGHDMFPGHTCESPSTAMPQDLEQSMLVEPVLSLNTSRSVCQP
jgi:hypothetical protein